MNMQSPLLLRTFFLLACLYLFSSHVTAASEVTIDAVTLLLPSNVCSQKLKPVSHKVRAHGGCFRWFSSSPHIVSVTNNPAEATALGLTPCTTSDGQKGLLDSLVSVVHDEVPTTKQRQSAWVWVEDIATGRRAEFEVFVDRIDKIIIGTSTRRINVGDTESLDVQAFDEHGDIFSTLQGLPFEWTNSAEHIARRLTFAEANMNVSSTRLALERTGFGTDRLPIQGLAPGRAHFTARLLCATGPEIQTSVEMLVTEPLGVFPTLTRVCPASSARLRAIARQHKTHLLPNAAAPDALGGVEVVEGNRVLRMPQQQYKWEADNSSLLAVDADIGAFTALAPGYAKVYLRDVALGERATTADVIVTEPARVAIVLHRQLPAAQRPLLASRDAPDARTRAMLSRDGMQSEEDFAEHDEYTAALPRCGDRYFLSPGAAFTAKVFVYDKWDRVIDVCDGLQVSLRGSGVSVVRDEQVQERDGALLTRGWVTLNATATGSAQLQVTLDTIRAASGFEYVLPNTLTATADLTITPPLTLPTTTMLLPAPPAPVSMSQLAQQCAAPLTVLGGSARLAWRTNDTDVLVPVPVNSATAPADYLADAAQPVYTHAARLHAMGQTGHALLSLRDRCNPDLRALLPVEAAMPNQLCVLPQSSELQVGRTTTLALVAKDARGRTFTDDSCLRVSVSVAEGTSVAVAAPQDNIAPRRCTPVLPGGAALPEQSCFEASLRAVQPGFARVEARLAEYAVAVDARREASPAQVDAALALAKKGVAGPFPGFRPVASQTFAVAEPLHLQHAEVVAAVGTTTTIAWSHGPLPWPCHTNGFSAPPGTFGQCELHGASLRAQPLPARGLATIASRAADNLYAHTPALTAAATVVGGGAEPVVSVSRADDDHHFALTCLDVTERDIEVEITVANAACPSNQWPQPMSARIRVRCVPALCVTPRRVTVPVGASFALDDDALQRHPLAAQATFFSEDPAIAEVKPDGTIVAKDLGVTAVHILVPHASRAGMPWGVDGLHDVVLVHVAYDGFRVEGATTLTQGHHGVLTLAGTRGDRAGDAAFRLVSAEWSVLSGPRAPVLAAPLTAGLPAIPAPASTSTLPLVPESAVTVTRGPSVRFSAVGAPGQYLVAARVRVHYPAPSPATLALLTGASPRASRCPAHPAIAAAGEVVERVVTASLTVEPALALLSPAAMTLPPAGVAQLLTSLDTSDDHTLTYALADAADSSVSVASRGWLTVAANADKHTVPVAITARGEAADASTQTVLAHVRVATPRMLDAVPVASYAPASEQQDPTARARLALTGDASSSPDLAPLCPQQPAAALERAARAHARMHDAPLVPPTVSLLSSPERLAALTLPTPTHARANVTFDLFARDDTGTAFTSMRLADRAGSLLLSCDRPDLVAVHAVALSPSFSLAHSIVANTTAPLASPASIASIATISVAALKVLPTPQRVTVTIAASTPAWVIPPLHLEVIVAAQSECAAPYATPLGARVAVPLAPHALAAAAAGLPIPADATAVDSKARTPSPAADFAAIWAGVDAAAAARLSHVVDRRRAEFTQRLTAAVADMLDASLRDAAIAAAQPLLAAGATEVTVQAPALHALVRAVDAHTAQALVDVLPVFSPSEYSALQARTLTVAGTTATLLPHASLWALRQPDAAEPAVTVADVLRHLARRFNVSLPTRQRSRTAAPLVDVSAIPPNVAAAPAAPFFPYRTERDARAASVLDFAQPLLTRLTEFPAASAALAAAALVTNAPSSTAITVAAPKNAQAEPVVTVPTLPAVLDAYWPFPGAAQAHWGWVDEDTVVAVHCMLHADSADNAACAPYAHAVAGAASILWLDALRYKRAAIARAAAAAPQATATSAPAPAPTPAPAASAEDYSMVGVFTACLALVGAAIFVHSAYAAQPNTPTAAAPQPRAVATAQPTLFFDYDSQREGAY